MRSSCSWCNTFELVAVAWQCCWPRLRFAVGQTATRCWPTTAFWPPEGAALCHPSGERTPPGWGSCKRCPTHHVPLPSHQMYRKNPVKKGNCQKVVESSHFRNTEVGKVSCRRVTAHSKGVQATVKERNHQSVDGWRCRSQRHLCNCTRLCLEWRQSFKLTKYQM